MRTYRALAKHPLSGALTLAGCLLALTTAARDARAQQPEPPFGPQPPFGPAPGAQPAPAPGGFGDPAAQPGQPAPGQPAPGGFGGDPAAQPGAAPGQFGGQASFSAGGSGFDGSASATTPAAPAGGADERELSLIHQNNLSGSTGLLRTAYAGSGAQGTFRVGFMFDWFSTSGFLCDPSNETEAFVPTTCSASDREDEASHVGGVFSLSATPLSFLEAYASIRTYANSNSEGTPQLLQVLGDTTLGVKGFTPPRFLGPLSFGGELQMLLLNGSGDVGLSGGATSAAIRALSSLDLRKPGGKGFPLLVNLNLGYKIDNSGAAVEDVEIARAAAFDDGRDFQPITRVERFGLGINKVDSFQTYLGAEVPLSFVQPFVEYTIDIPVNRQGYECRTNSVSRGDVCLGLTDLSNSGGDGAGFSYVPSRISLGARVSPFKKAFRGLSGLLAFDIGVTGTSAFVEEVAPQAPWTLYLGLGYAFDTQEKVVEVAAPAPAAPVIIPAPQTLVRGFVHEQNQPTGVPNAIVAFQGGAQPPLATGADGRFLSRHLEPGTYTFEITAPGFKPGTCTATVTAAAPPAPAAGGAPGQFGAGGAAPGAPGGQFGAAGGAGQFAPPPAPQGPSFVDLDCPVEALPRTGNIVGQVKDSGGSGVGGAVVTVTDSLGKEQRVTADGGGNFRVDGLPPGDTSMRVEATGFMNHVSQTEVRASEDARAVLNLNKRPKNALVKIQGNEIKISDKILFETDSAKILGQSSALLEEVAEVMQKNPNITLVEIQGHTDNTGSRDRNQRLSDERANAVRSWLVKAGIAGSRLQAKGYGQDRPVAPNVTEGNRSKNRRVQFIILKK